MAATDTRTTSTSTPTNVGEEEEERDVESPHHEEAIYTLLFQECDKDGNGLVAVEALVQYIQKMQLGQHSSQEDVYDSQDDLQGVQYNLQLLKAMLEVNAVEGLVDEETYSHVIRMWVKDIRDRNEPGSPQPLEVSQLSDSEDEVEGPHSSGHLSRESFETSGGASSIHTDLDKLDLLNSLQDLRLDNRRLQERNHQLQTQMEHSEEHLREILTENDDLKLKLKGIQQSLARLEELEGENTDLSTAVQGKQEACQELTANVERLEQEMEGLRSEMVLVQSHLTNTYSEKVQLEEEQKALQQILLAKEELVSQQEASKEQLMAQLHEYQQKTEDLNRAVAAVGEENEALKTENTELQSHTDQKQHSYGPPMYSTPYRSEPPSLHEELLAQQGSSQGLISPLIGKLDESQNVEDLDSSGAGDDDFSRIIQQAHTQHSRFQQKSDLLVHELNDLISSHAHGSSTSSQRTTTTHILGDESFLSFENKLTEYARRKRQNERAMQKLRDQLKHLQNENQRLRQQLEELNQKLQEQKVTEVKVDREEMAREDAGVQTDSRRLDLDAVELRDEGVQVGREGEMRRGEDELDLPVFEQMVLSDRLGEEHPLVGAEAIQDLAKKQQEFSRQYSQLEERAKQLESDQQAHLDEWSTTKHLASSLASSIYRVMKGIFLFLIIIVLLLSLLVLLFLFQAALDDCAGYCPHSAIHIVFSALGPHLQYTRAPNVPI